MAFTSSGAARLSSSTIRCVLRPQSTNNATTSAVSQQVRYASKDALNPMKHNKNKSMPGKKKVERKTFRCYDLKDAEQFALTDAMQYLRACEIGKNPQSTKYEIHVKLNTLKNGPSVRNRIQLPNPVRTEMKIAVICDPKSKAGIAATNAGAHIVGEESIFEAVRAGNIDFDRAICHTDSVQKLNDAKVARILGPKGMMPSVKLGTVSGDCASLIRDMSGASEYRERSGVIRLPIGQLRFAPRQLSDNVRFFLSSVKRDLSLLSDSAQKSIHEVVLSSTHGPGFSLNGDYRSSQSPKENEFNEKTIPANVLSDIAAFDALQQAYTLSERKAEKKVEAMA